MLYPLTFVPRYVQKIWGGRKIETVLGKNLPANQLIGESWELYDFPPGAVEGSTGWVSAAVANGPLAGKTLHELVERFGHDLLGDVSLAGGGQFPILIKYLDAREDLSVQVHPDEAYCRKHPEAHLKSEAWYVMQADGGSRLYKGLKKGVTAEALRAGIEAGRVESLIEAHAVKAGDCHYLPSGTIHALGAGILAAEVQTPSDTTFRVYDFERVDPSTGRKRALHVSQALECIDFSGRQEPQPRTHMGGYFTTVTRLASCPYFTLEKVRMAEGVEQAIPYDQPVVWMMLEGKARLTTADAGPLEIGRGQTVLLPAKMKSPAVAALSDCVWLETTLPV